MLKDLQDLKPFDNIPNHKHDSFQDISADPLATLDKVDLDKWLEKQTRKLMLDAFLMQDEEDELWTYFARKYIKVWHVLPDKRLYTVDNNDHVNQFNARKSFFKGF